MEFKKYEHAPDWETSLSIFLFVEIVVNKKSHKNVSIESHKTFELKDTYINSYNEFISSKAKLHDEIERWLNNKSEIDSFRENFGTTFKQKVSVWSDRNKTEYYKQKLQASFDFENYLEALFKKKYAIDLKPFFTPDGQYSEGENEAGIEIKNDTLIKKTGNVYIEYAEKSNADNTLWVNSGILKDDKMKYFLIGDKDGFWIFRKSRLVEIYKEEKAKKEKGEHSERSIVFKQIKTSSGFIYPVKQAVKETISMETLVSELK